MATKTKKSNSKASTRNSKGKTTGKTTKKTTGKVNTSKKKSTTPPKSTTKKTTPKKTASPKVYKNEKGKVIYRETTDKVGDILINGAGLKFKITSERRAKPKGYDDGKLKVRVLTVSQGKEKIEMLDTDLKHYRDAKVLRRIQK